MRKCFVGLLTATAAVVLLAGSALAQGRGPERPGVTEAPARAVNGWFQPCANGERCLLRAVADFNGDGVQDLLMESVPRTAGGGRGQVQTPDSRALALFLGPFPTTSGRTVDPVSRIWVMPERNVTSLSTPDLNGDGLADLVVTGTQRVGNKERQRVAVLFGRRSWVAEYKLGPAARGDVVVEREVTLPRKAEAKGMTSVLGAVFADVNGDGMPDLVLSADPPAAEAGLPGAASSVSVMLGNGPWKGQLAFKPASLITQQGLCERGLGGVADVTGDGLADIVVRQCAGDGLPDKPLVVPGRANWGSEVALAALPVSRPQIVPPPEQPTRTPPNRGYIGGSSANLGPLDPGPLMVLEDLNGDGIRDVAFEFGGRMHVFDGGPDIADHLAAGESQRIFLNTGFGGVPMTRGWGPGNLLGDGGRDLVLGRVATNVDAGGQHRSDQNGRPITIGKVGALVLFPNGFGRSAVVDAAAPVGTALELAQDLTLWATADVNGDGRTDLILGDNPETGLSRYGVVLGPVAPGRVGLVATP